jgi:hypothetical protein
MGPHISEVFLSQHTGHYTFLFAFAVIHLSIQEDSTRELTNDVYQFDWVLEHCNVAVINGLLRRQHRCCYIKHALCWRRFQAEK